MAIVKKYPAKVVSIQNSIEGVYTLEIEADYKQTLNNIVDTNFKLGLLVNFGTPSLIYKRVIN